MSLQVGTKLGPYEILAPIGAGGMGEVYRARDTKLDRDVAIKVLPAALAQDPERLARFEREAKVLAALNHPNIAQIYGLEQSDGIRALVMELVPGNTLKGPVPLETALNYARQIADALEAAHEKGITHRDLKPANIMITPAGVVKVLDFGLAAVAQDPISSTDSSNSPTLTMRTTQGGMILGTACYMSPEQARGRAVDRRTDIWSFGVVVYEMTTGRQPFGGEDITEILAAVVKSEPDWNSIPTRLQRLLKSCLEKDSKKRLQAIGDVRLLLEEPLPVSREHASPRGWIAATVIFALAALSVSFLHFRETQPADPVLNLSVPLPANTPAGFLAISPDGRRLVMRLAPEGKNQLWLRSLDSPQLQPLPGTENGRNPFWSPDGKFIGFFADGKLKTMPATGGPPQVLCEGTGLGTGGTWNRDGVILFGTEGDMSTPLRRVSATGGACTVVTRPEGGSRHSSPEFLPDGKHFLYVVTEGDEAKSGLYVSSLDNPAGRRVLADQSSAIFARSTTGKKYGYLLFLRDSVLVAQPFDAQTLQIAGDVFPVAAEASFSLTLKQVAASVSSEGLLVYESNFLRQYQLIWLDRSGKEIGKVGDLQDQRHVALSPDGKTVATVRRYQGLWLYDVLRGGETRFTAPPLVGTAPVWSPDGNVVAFSSGNGLYMKDASGGVKEELLLRDENVKTPSDWSRDGRYLVYTEIDPKGNGDIWFLPDPLQKSSGRRPVKFQGTDTMEGQGQLSPDGHWIAYVSKESGPTEVYVRPFPSGPGRWKIGTGHEPRWRRDGKELFYWANTKGDAKRLMAVATQSGPRGEFQAGVSQPLFEFRAINYTETGSIFLYSPSVDGQRFLVNVQVGNTEPTLNVITNWEKAAAKSR